jgi:acyl-CoA thioesterase I
MEMEQRRTLLKSGLLLACLWKPLATAAAQAGCRLTVLGDSLTAGFGVALDQAFPGVLEQALRERGLDCAVLNAGVSGDTSAGGLARLDWVLADHPTHLLVELGANDALRALPVDQLASNLDAIVARAKQAGIEVMLAGMLAPRNLGSDYANEFEASFRNVAGRHGVPLYPFFLAGVVQGEALDPALMQDDGIHPNAAGIRAIVEDIEPAIVAWLRDQAKS